MDKVEKYGNIIVEILKKYADVTFSYADVESVVMIDKEKKHYQLCRVGWTQKEEKIYGPVFHISIKNEKVYIEYNSSDIVLSEELLSKGIPKSDIVIAVHPKSMRQYTDYAVA